MIGCTTEERFWSKVERTTVGCWEWQAGTFAARGGYGQFWADDARPAVKAHRFAYELMVGPIPDGLTLDHLCVNPICVNPEHLEPVTNEENVRRGRGPASENRRKTRCTRGHPFDEVNTYVRPQGGRDCRACMAARKAAS